MMNLYYENHLGERIYFYRSPYVLVDHGIFNWTMTYNTVRNRSSGFRLVPVERNVNIRIIPTAKTRIARSAMFAKLYDDFVNIIAADKDVCGKLWTETGEYLECRFIAGDKSAWALPKDVTLSCRVLIDYPMWQKPTAYSLDAFINGGSGGSEGSEDSEGSDRWPYLDYPHGYPYDYKGTFLAQKTVPNDGTSPSDYILTINGPASNPKIVINGVTIGANVVLGAGEQLEINTRDKTVYIISNGAKLDVFNKRYKGAVSMFEPLPVGDVSIMWDGNNNAVITVLSERLEPKWS